MTGLATPTTGEDYATDDMTDDLLRTIIGWSIMLFKEIHRGREPTQEDQDLWVESFLDTLSDEPMAEKDVMHKFADWCHEYGGIDTSSLLKHLLKTEKENLNDQKRD